MRRRTFGFALGGVLAAGRARAVEIDKLNVAVGQRGAWDTSVCEFGTRAGIFQRHGLDLNLLFTDGGSDTQLAVISGGCDVGIGGGLISVIGAVAKGAPLRVISSNFIGASDSFWYTLAESGIRDFTGAEGKTVAFSTVGGMTYWIAQALMARAGVKAKLVPTGSPTATLTQVMSKQIDVGYSVVPFALREAEQGTLRYLGNGEVFPELATQTVRCLITNDATLAGRMPALRRFMAAYRDSLDWMYADPRAVEWYAELNAIQADLAQRTRDQRYPRHTTRLGPPVNVALSMRQALDLRRLSKPMTEGQVERMLAIIEPPAA